MTTRRKPEPTRKGITRKIRVARIELYVTINTYEDGEPCELLSRQMGRPAKTATSRAGATCWQSRRVSAFNAG
jgi:hypothetical protein